MKERIVPGWEEYFLDMIDCIKKRSIDRSVQVGCVIVDKDNSILSTGYNGFPRGVTEGYEERHERPLKYKYTEHAERNAIYNAARNGVKLKGSTIYQKMWPCTDCARGIIQSGIKDIVVDSRGYNESVKAWSERWKEDINIAHEMLYEGLVNCYIWIPEYNEFKKIGRGNWKEEIA